MKVIAHIYTEFPEKFGIPRQSGLVKGLRGKIVFEPQYRMQSVEDYIRDLFTSRDFKTLTEGVSTINVEKIRRGMVDNGMTKQEVRLAYGPPCKYKTPDETLNTWLFWTELLVGKRIVFNNDKVTDILVL